VTSPDRGWSVRRLRDETRVAAGTDGTIVECLVRDVDLVSPGQPPLRPHPEGDTP
jgi:[acyl-carrier-protein] S-malonyltransferase